MFKFVIIPLAIIVALGWAAYGIYTIVMRRQEKEQPRQKSERLEKAQDSLAKYASKMAEYKKKPYQREDEDKGQ